MNIKRKLITGIASTAILLNALAPLAFADTSLVISGNGADTQNNVEVKTATQTVQVQQSNTANVTNNVTANAKTGGNEAEKNTGGDVKIDTGNATSTVKVGTTVNSNQADVKCDTCGGDVTATISGNGTGSKNTVDLGGQDKRKSNDPSNGVSLLQTNNAYVTNNVVANAKTGGNEAEKNTGGMVTINTGDAKSDVTVSNMANENMAMVGGTGDGSSITATISGNGSKSNNEIELDNHNSIEVWQANDANVTNNVTANAKTGGNEAEKNTGGNVKIDTGDATAKVKVDNKVNFNSVDADCGCTLDLTAKIAGNGDSSKNKIEAKGLSSELVIAQGGPDLGNDAYLANNIGANAKTGKNEVEDSTAQVLPGDPVEVWTGNATNDLSVSNAGNQNIVGPSSDADWQMPDFSGMSLDFHFSLSDLMSFLHLG